MLPGSANFSAFFSCMLKQTTGICWDDPLPACLVAKGTDVSILKNQLFMYMNCVDRLARGLACLTCLLHECIQY